ncbi:MAG: type III pantothenate kinase [Crocinitomicaceae bacterium]|nr:type III pantothenate kinase [Crocinitomicaceae bacterium]
MSQQKARNIIIDAGNTRTKIAVFEESSLIDLNTISNTNWQDILKSLASYKNENSLLCSVLGIRKTQELAATLGPKIIFSPETATPVDFSGYATAETLGADRKANSIATWSRLPSEYGLVIDVGTCIKFDLVNAQGKYLGGSISPGLNMRLKALSDNTGRLPYVKVKNTEAKLIGNSTESAILSGCLNGWKAEINGFLAQYKTAFDDLTIFLTGGDIYLLDSLRKNGIFADENLTLKGLNLILAYNA